MTNEELTKALQTLEDEFGAGYEEHDSAYDDTYRGYTIRIGDAYSVVSTRKDDDSDRMVIGARLETPSAMDEWSGGVDLEYAETILVWVRAKLLELTREKRAATLDMLLDLLPLAGPDLCSDVRRVIHMLAFGGEE